MKISELNGLILNLPEYDVCIDISDCYYEGRIKVDIYIVPPINMSIYGGLYNIDSNIDILISNLKYSFDNDVIDNSVRQLFIELISQLESF